MNVTNQKEIAIDLIANDLVNTKLILGLQALHIDAGLYSMYLAESIFVLMGCASEQCSPDMYDLYAQLTRRAAEAAHIDEERTAVKTMAREIYGRLVKGVHRSA